MPTEYLQPARPSPNPEVPTTRYILPALAVVPLLAPPRPRTRTTPRRTWRPFRGAWKIVSSETGGIDRPGEAEGHLIVSEDDTFALKKGDEVGLKGTLNLDPSNGPRAIDIDITEGGREGEKEKVLHGIYELGKGMLKWWTSEPGGTDRPEEFSTREGVNHMLVTLNKEKP